jgi:D-glycerate 3-kinase
MRGLGLAVEALSIDDFDLTQAASEQLASRNPNHFFLQQRGYPGTHDVRLGVQTLTILRGLRAGEKTSIPRYDKSAHQGKGDRLPQNQWPVVSGPFEFETSASKPMLS